MPRLGICEEKRTLDLSSEPYWLDLRATYAWRSSP